MRMYVCTMEFLKHVLDSQMTTVFGESLYLYALTQDRAMILLRGLPSFVDPSVVIVGGREWPATDPRPFNQWPAVMTHDAMTGEMPMGNQADNWVITQSAGLLQQLWCGARAFDYRPFCKGGEVFAHHGGILVNKNLQDSVADVRSWLKQVPQALVLFYISHFAGDGNCGTTVNDWLHGLGVYTLQCEEVGKISVAEVYKRGLRTDLGQGGSLVAITDCMDERYDDTVNCYTSPTETCFSGPGDGGNQAWNRMKSYYVTSTLNRGNALWMTQLHWQSTAATITVGTLRGGSVLKDEERGLVNAWAGLALQNQGGSLAPQVTIP